MTHLLCATHSIRHLAYVGLVMLTHFHHKIDKEAEELMWLLEPKVKPLQLWLPTPLAFPKAFSVSASPEGPSAVRICVPFVLGMLLAKKHRTPEQWRSKPKKLTQHFNSIGNWDQLFGCPWLFSSDSAVAPSSCLHVVMSKDRKRQVHTLCFDLRVRRTFLGVPKPDFSDTTMSRATAHVQT